MQIPMMRTDRLYHVTANWLTNTQKRYTRDFLICAENKQDAEKITRNHIPNQFITTNNPTDTTDIHIRVRDLGLSQKNRTYYVSPIQETTRVIADEPSILEETATYFARLFGYEQGALASKSELTDAQSTRLKSLNTLCKDTQMFWKLAGEFLYLKNADPTDFCRKKIEELTNTVNLDELANENASSVAPTSVDTSAIIDAAKKQADFIIAQAKETAEIIINNAKQTANIITANATNVGANTGAVTPTTMTQPESTNTYVNEPADIDEELPFAEQDESVVTKKSNETAKQSKNKDDTESTKTPITTPTDESVNENKSMTKIESEVTSTTTNDNNTATESTTESASDTKPTTNTDTIDESTENTVQIIEEHMKERASDDIQTMKGMSYENLLQNTLDALQNMPDDEFLTIITDTEFIFESNITPMEYFKSELNKNADLTDGTKTATKASILASIAGNTDDSMLIDYAVSLVIESTNENTQTTMENENTTSDTEDTSENDSDFSTYNTDDDYNLDNNDESYDEEAYYNEEEPNYPDDNEGNSDI